MERLYLKPSLCKAIAEYCEVNKIDDVNAFANRCATQGFNIAKYGLSPVDNIERENKGIKDFKNEGRKKRKEQPGVPGEKEQSKEQENTSPVPQRKEESSKSGESKPTEHVKSNVTVRKIRIIKKDKND